MSSSASSFSSTTDGMSPLLIATIVLTLLAAVAGAVYMSGAADDVVHYAMEKYFKAEAKAEEKVLEKSGEKYAEGFLKDRLKKNPVVSNDELNEVSSGLGDEAAEEFGKGKLGERIGKAFD